MATIAPVVFVSPVRQPFASLDGARLRNLTNVKNRQNAFPVPSSVLTKRPRTPDNFADFDSENIDPELYSSPSKKSKNVNGFAIKTVQSSRFVLKQNHDSALIASRPIATSKRLSLSTNKKPPSSAPTVAGRSPKSKRAGILSRRRVSSSPFTRVDPPSFGSNVSGNGLPFSIDAALCGTVSSGASKPTVPAATPLETSMPRSWLFNIHEDTPDEELGNLMQHSTQTLDISDDESKGYEADERGKENIPPTEISSVRGIPVETAGRAISRKDMMTDETRKPLGDLDARDFYAEGCNIDSLIIVPEGKEACDFEKPFFAFGNMQKAETPSPVGPSCNQDVWKDLLAKVNAASPVAGDTVPDGQSNEIVKLDGPIEIWESESAKGEDSTVQEEILP